MKLEILVRIFFSNEKKQKFREISINLGESIKRITCVNYETLTKPVCITDRQSMVQAARGLLSAVTRVLLMADLVVVKQIITVKKKVILSLFSVSSIDSTELNNEIVRSPLICRFSQR